MANLIPPSAQKNISREYFLRVLAVWFYAVASGLLVTALVLGPVYVLVRSQTTVYSGKYETAADVTSDYKAAEEVLLGSASVARMLLEENSFLEVSEYLKLLFTEFSGSKIKLNNFQFTGYEDSLVISGVAATRTDLSKFKTALENSGYFSRVELPISSLASESDISFSMNLTLSNKEKD